MRFLLEKKLEGLEFTDAPHQPSLFPVNGRNVKVDHRYAPLLNPPAPGQRKLDQVLDWAIAQTEKEAAEGR